MDEKPYLVTAYFTVGTIYESSAKVLRKSLERLDIPFHIAGVPNLGSWNKNTSYKPTFILSMMKKFPDLDIVYVDVDAEFLSYPHLFDIYGSTMTHDVAAYIFDRSCYKRSPKGSELLSGTLYFRNTQNALRIVERWESRTQRNESEWDQKSLEWVLDGKHDLLPGEYCKIFDRMPSVTEPIIVHYQASRKVRRNEGKLT